MSSPSFHSYPLQSSLHYQPMAVAHPIHFAPLLASPLALVSYTFAMALVSNKSIYLWLVDLLVS